MRCYRISRLGRVAVQDDDGWRVVGRVEPVTGRWLALDAQDRRLYGPHGPLWPDRETAARTIAEAVVEEP